MSDESQPPPLRLKPRIRSEAEPAPGVTPAPATPPPPVVPPVIPAASVPPVAPPPVDVPAEKLPPPPGGEMRVRLKPRMPGETPATPAPVLAEMPPLPPRPGGEPPASAPGAGPAEPAPLTLPPIGTVPPTDSSAVAGDAAGKFKLKPKAPGSDPAALIPPPAVPVAPTVPAAPPPLNMIPPPITARSPMIGGLPSDKLSLQPKVPHIRGPEGEMASLDMPPPLHGKPAGKGGKKGVLIGVGLGVVLLVVAGYFAYDKYLAAPPPAPIRPVKKTTPAGPTPSATLNQIAAAPKQAIDKAQTTIAASQEKEQTPMAEVIPSEPPPAKPAVAPPPPPRLPAKAPAASAAPVPSTTLAPGVTATTGEVMAAPQASPAFKRFVADARISGVFQGTPARAIINGRMARAGDVLDQAIGVVFDNVDSDSRTITFKDARGVTITRRY